MASAPAVAAHHITDGGVSPSTGFASTLNKSFQGSVHRFPERPALSYKQDGAFRIITYAALAEEVHIVASALYHLGVRKGDRVAILAENGPDWVRADLGSLSLGAATVPIYATLPPNQIAYLLNDSGARAIVVGDTAQLAKVMEIRGECPALQEIILVDGSIEPGVRTREEIFAMGREFPIPDDEYAAMEDGVDPEDAATIIYTSGTTGDPKGVELTHSNFMKLIPSVVPIIPWDERDVFLSFLPLCHIYERAIGYYLAMSRGGHIAYVEGNTAVERISRLPLSFMEVKPTLFLGMPRLYEKMKERIEDAAAKAGPNRKKVFDWAISVGLKAARVEMRGGRVDRVTAMERALADKLVFRTVRERFGGNIRFLVSGGAALDAEVLEFYNACGLTMIEGYGLTETTSIVLCNRPRQMRAGTVGLPSDTCEIKFADDGEILCRGGNVMRGYWNKPEATQQVLEPDGWFHTGDLGEYVEGRFVRITGRKKDLIVLSNGKKVAPQDIETSLKNSPYITDLALMGDGCRNVVALIVPNFERLRHELGAPADPAELAADRKVHRFMRQELDRLSGNLADFEKIRRFALMDHEFSIENGELTPTMKVKRHVLKVRYKDILADLTS